MNRKPTDKDGELIFKLMSMNEEERTEELEKYDQDYVNFINSVMADMLSMLGTK